MRKIICPAALLTLGVVVALWFCGIPKQPDQDAGNMAHHPLEQQPLRTPSTETDEKFDANNKESEKAVRPRVYKPKSLQVGEGGATVVEIDHGLKPVRLLNWERYSDDVQKGKRKGAIGAITLRVVDTEGIPVTGAKLFGGFWNNSPDDPPATGTSDENGEISLEHVCTGDLNFSITKKGYYASAFRYWFFKTGFDCAKDGRWLPWNPIVEVTLKEKKNPVEMIGQDRLLLAFPMRQTAGFDLEVGDLVAPLGNGKDSDVSFWFDSWQSFNPYCYSNRFVVTAGKNCEIVTMGKDSFSNFKFAYAPPDSGWVSGLTLGMVRTEDKISSDVSLGKGEYWVVAVPRRDKKRFAVISDFEFGGSDRGTNYCGVLLSYYLNPNPDDANLENKNIR
jgi:hypothetical protein